MSMQVAPSSEYLNNPKHSWWSQRTSLERKLLVAFSTTFLLSLLLCAMTIVFGIRGLEPRLPKPDDPGVCRTKVCIETASKLKSLMDESVDPCHDFYNFACGSFMRNYKIPSTGYIEIGPTSDASRQLEDDVRDILSHHPMDETVFNSKNSALKLYRTCMEQQYHEEMGHEFLRQLLLKYLSGWPMGKRDWSEKDFDWSKNLAKIMRELDENFLFNLDVNPDYYYNSSRYHLSMIFKLPSQFIGIGIMKDDPLQSPEILKSSAELKSIIRTIVCEVNQECDNTDQLNEDIDNLTTTLTQIEDMKEETNYATSKDILNLMEMNNLYAIGLDEYKNSIKNLQEKIPQVDWNTFFNVLFEDTEFSIKEDFTFLASIENLSPIIKYLNVSSQRSVANYFGWKLLSFWGQLFSPTIEYLVNPTMSHQRNCQIYVKNTMGYAVGKLYLDKFVSKDTLDETRQMMRDVNIAFGEILKDNSWMDKKTKDFALQKLNNLVGTVGSPDWVFNETELDNYFSEIINSKKFNFTTGFQISQNQLFKKKAKLLSGPVDRRNNWRKSPLVTNAYYNFLTNSMYYTLGILEPPFYEFSRPRAMNLGSFGFISGHEITHGFDSNGRKYDESGLFSDWWTPESLAIFNKQADCFEKQYSDIKDPMTNMNLNGKKTLGENIADNGGVRAAFLAYKNITQQQGGRLYGLENYSEDQLFFIAMATTWCTNTNAETMMDTIKTEVHSPNKYRAYIPFRNFPEFSKAFNCKSGTPMNPTHKCIIW